MLVRMTLKTRWWWILSDSIDNENINFLWTS